MADILKARAGKTNKVLEDLQAAKARAEQIALNKQQQEKKQKVASDLSASVAKTETAAQKAPQITGTQMANMLDQTRQRVLAQRAAELTAQQVGSALKDRIEQRRSTPNVLGMRSGQVYQKPQLASANTTAARNEQLALKSPQHFAARTAPDMLSTRSGQAYQAPVHTPDRRERAAAYMASLTPEDIELNHMITELNGLRVKVDSIDPNTNPMEYTHWATQYNDLLDKIKHFSRTKADEKQQALEDVQNAPVTGGMSISGQIGARYLHNQDVAQAKAEAATWEKAGQEEKLAFDKGITDPRSAEYDTSNSMQMFSPEALEWKAANSGIDKNYLPWISYSEIRTLNSLSGADQDTYRRMLIEAATYREAGYLLDTVDKNDPVEVAALAVSGGLGNAFGGLAQSWNSKVKGDYTPVLSSANSLATGALSEQLHGVMKGVADVGQALGFMLPTIAVSMITRNIGGLFAARSAAKSVQIASKAGAFGEMYESSSGMSFQQALEQGYKIKDAKAYATINGLLEAGLQSVLGGYRFMGANAWDAAGKALAKTKLGASVTNKLTRVSTAMAAHPATRYLFQTLEAVGAFTSRAGEEFVEEWMQAWLDPAMRNAILDENNEVKPFSEEALYNGLIGGLTAGLFNIAGVTSDWQGTRMGRIVDITKRVAAVENNRIAEINYALAADEDSVANALVQDMYQKIISGDAADITEADWVALTLANDSYKPKERTVSEQMRQNEHSRMNALEIGLQAQPGTESNIRARQVYNKLIAGEDISESEYQGLAYALEQDVKAGIVGNGFAPVQQTKGGEVNRQQAARYGEQGQQVYAALRPDYDEQTLPMTNYDAAFSILYAAGAQGVKLDDALNSIGSLADRTGAGTITYSEAQRIYEAGKADGLNGRANEGYKHKVRNANAGLEENEYSNKFSTDDKTEAKELGKKLGVKIIVAKHGSLGMSEDGQHFTDGKYDSANGIIYVDEDVTSLSRTVLKHELLHRVRNMAPEQYEIYKKGVLTYILKSGRADVYGLKMKNLFQNYVDGKSSRSEDFLIEEFMGDFTRDELFKDTGLLQEMAKEHRGVVQKILDIIRDLIAMFKGEWHQGKYNFTQRQLRDMERMFVDALNATAENVKNAEVVETGTVEELPAEEKAASISETRNSFTFAESRQAAIDELTAKVEFNNDPHVRALRDRIADGTMEEEDYDEELLNVMEEHPEVLWKYDTWTRLHNRHRAMVAGDEEGVARAFTEKSTEPLMITFEARLNDINKQLDQVTNTLRANQRLAEAKEAVLPEVDVSKMPVSHGVPYAPEVVRIMESDDYITPEDKEARYSVTTKDPWAESHVEVYGDTPESRRQIKIIDQVTNEMVLDDVINGFIPGGTYDYDSAGPLRSNSDIYVITFDMDTTCPRTIQFREYVTKIEKTAGRMLTEAECVNLLELMRAYGLIVPCTYCYVETKRMALSGEYNNWFIFHHNVVNAATDEEAKAAMYGRNKKTGKLSDAATKVLAQWRQEKDYDPSVENIYADYHTARNSVLNLLDQWREAGKLPKAQSTRIKKVCEFFGVTDSDAKAEVKLFVDEWVYDMQSGNGHHYKGVNDPTQLEANEKSLSTHHKAMKYAKSSSGAHDVNNYVPYTDQLKNYLDKRDYLNAIGGVRKHSSNDFRIDYVQDYLLFYADLAAGGFMGHTYSKSIDFARIFGWCGDRINMSIAMYGDDINDITENIQEGAGWRDVQELRAASPNIGSMAMVVNDAQLSYALNADWIDMIIPFHASGLKKAVWYNMHSWLNYTSIQEEKFPSAEELTKVLVAEGVDIDALEYKAFSDLYRQHHPEGDLPSLKVIKEILAAEKIDAKGLKSQAIKARYYQDHPVKEAYTKDKKGNLKRWTPHFLPGELHLYDAQGNEITVEGHHNDKATYLRLCEEYGVHPRFDGRMVTDANGNEINVVDHPNYMKLVKETARTDTPQQPIEFNFDQREVVINGKTIDVTKYLGGKTPLEYTMSQLRAQADIGGFENLKEDPYDVVNEFIQQYLGKNRPLGYLTERAANTIALRFEKQYGEDRVDEEIRKQFPVLSRLSDEVDIHDDEFGVTPVPEWEQTMNRYAEMTPEQVEEYTGVKADLKRKNNQRSSISRISPAQDEEYLRLAADPIANRDALQRMVDEAAEAAGYRVRGNHGTVNFFTVFDRERGNAEGNWGKGFYFTDNEDDAEENYANTEGEDLDLKITLAADRMIGQEGTENMEFDELLDLARKQFIQGEPHVIKAALRMDNPVIFGGTEETYFDFNENYDEETDEYGEAEGKLVDFMQAVEDELAENYEWENPERYDSTRLYEYAFDGGLTATQLEEQARQIYGNINDEEGNYAVGEFLRSVFERMGYDGIVDHNVAQKFGSKSGRKDGGMIGVDEDTTHYIVFESNQIKETDPVTYDDNGNVIPLSERFNTEEDDIRYSKEVWGPEDAAQENIIPATREEAKMLDALDHRNLVRYWDEVSSVLDGTMQSNQLVMLGRPSQILKKYLKSENLLYMPQSAVKKTVLPKTVKGGKHGLGRAVVDELLYQFDEPLAITGNTTQHEKLGDNSVVVWTDWQTEAGSSIIVPIRIDADGAVGIYHNVNTTFDLYNQSYMTDLLREGNVLYTRDEKSIDELLAQRRQVPKWKSNNASMDIIPQPEEEVNPIDERAKEAGLFRRNAGEELDVHIPDGIDTVTGEPVDFIDLILDGIKKGETRSVGSGLPVGKWVGLAKNGVVYGRVKFGEHITITKDSPEYGDAMIAGTDYDIPDGGSKWYYPVVEVMDLRDDPRDEVRRGPKYGTYQFKSAAPVTYDDEGNPIPIDQRMDVENSDRRYSLSVQDKEYLRLAEDPEANRDALQRMVDEAAKAAGYTFRGFHGTPYGNFKIFRSGERIVLTDNKDIADGYADKYGSDFEGKDTLNLYADDSTGGIITLDMKGMVASRIPRTAIKGLSTFMRGKAKYKPNLLTMQYLRPDEADTNAVVDFFAHKYGDQLKAVKFLNIIDPARNQELYGEGEMEYAGTVLFELSNNRVKSADPVTYDDEGNVIPLSERFNRENPDRRYSLSQIPEELENLAEGPRSPEEMISLAMPSQKTGVKAGLEKNWHTFQRLIVDAGETVHRISEALDDPSLYTYYNNVHAAQRRAEKMMELYAADVKGQRTGKSLNAIFDPIRAKGKDYYRDFQLYLYHQHNMDLMSREDPEKAAAAKDNYNAFLDSYPAFQRMTQQEIDDIAWNNEHPLQTLAKEYNALASRWNYYKNLHNKPVFGVEVTAEESAKEVSRLQGEHEEFRDLARDVYGYVKNLQQYRVSCGLISQMSVDHLNKLYPHYVPTYLLDEQGVTTGPQDAVTISSTVKEKSGNFKQVKLMPLHVALANQTRTVTRNGAMNLFGQRLLNAYQQLKTELNMPLPKELEKKRQGRDKVRGDIIRVSELYNSFNPEREETINDIPDAINVTGAAKSNSFTVRLGDAAYEMVVSPELFAAIKALSPSENANERAVLSWLAKANNIFKSLCTGYNPIFTAKNFIRDLQDVLFYSRDLRAFARNYPRAWKEIAKGGKHWETYQSLGGLWSSFYDYETGELNRGNKLRKWTLGRIETLNEWVEQAPRLAEFMSAVDKVGGVEKATMDQLMDAMYAAADVTVNFGRKGTASGVINTYAIPFFNPAVQGFSKFVRRFTETKGPKKWANLICKAALFGIAPSLINQLLYADDDDWDELNDSDKNLCYCIKIGDGLWIKIPKGRALSIFGLFVNAGERVASGDEVDWWDYVKTGAEQVAPTNPFTSNIFYNVTTAHLFDKDNPGTTWYGSDIESQRLQNYEPSQRYDAKTDTISKWIGKQLGLSPKKINYIIDQYSGIIGDVVLPLLTPAAERNAFVKGFTIDSAQSNKLSNEFYELKDDLTYAKNSPNADETDELAVRWINKQAQGLAEINQAIRDIENDKKMSDKEKKDALHVQYNLRNELIRNALDTYGTWRNSMEDELRNAKTMITEDDIDTESLTAEDIQEKLTSLRQDYAFRAATKDVYGAEAALAMWDDAVYNKAKEINDVVSYDDFFEVYTDYSLRKYHDEGSPYMAIVDYGMSDAEATAMLSQMMPESQYERVALGAGQGMSTISYIRFQDIKKNFDYDGNNSYKQGEIEDALRSLMRGGGGLDFSAFGGHTFNAGISETDAAILWQISNSGWKWYNNPFSQGISHKIYDALHADKTATSFGNGLDFSAFGASGNTAQTTSANNSNSGLDFSAFNF